MNNKFPRHCRIHLLALCCIGGIAVSGLAHAQSSTCASNEATQNLDAGSNPWSAGSLSYSASIGTGASAVNVTASATNNNWSGGSPVSGAVGGFASGFTFTVDYPNVTASNTITFTFSKPINRLRLVGADLDTYGSGGDRYGDELAVSGLSPTGTTVLPSSITPASNLVAVSGTAAYVSGNAANGTNCDFASGTGCNATFDFNAPISSLTIVYANHVPPANGNPPSQAVGVVFGGFCVQNPNPGVTKAAPATATVNAPFNFTLTASNPGSASTPVGIQVNDTIDASRYTINSITAASGWTCTPNSGFPINTGSIAVACTSTATLAAGASGVAVATINVTPKASALPGPIGNTASIPAGSGGDISNANNSSSTSTTLSSAQSDIRITKTNTPGQNGNVDLPGDTVTQGGTTTYTITVSNVGPDAANGALVTDPATTGLTCSTASCSATGGAACPAQSGAALVSALQGAGATIPTLPNGGSVAITLTCTVN